MIDALEHDNLNCGLVGVGYFVARHSSFGSRRRFSLQIGKPDKGIAGVNR